MRLLLDEHFSPDVARALRERGHDVVTVPDRPELRGEEDSVILDRAADEGRVVVTVDVRDFSRLGLRRLPSLKPHFGIVLVTPMSFSASSRGFGRLIRALEALLAAHLGDEDLVADVHWLQPVPEDQSTD